VLRSLIRSLAIAFPEDITQIFPMKHSDWLRLQSEGESIWRVMPAAEFEVVFDVPNEQLQHTTDQKEGSNQIFH
jgi:hypothetical protein